MFEKMFDPKICDSRERARRLVVSIALAGSSSIVGALLVMAAEDTVIGRAIGEATKALADARQASIQMKRPIFL